MHPTESTNTEYKKTIQVTNVRVLDAVNGTVLMISGSASRTSISRGRQTVKLGIVVQRPQIREAVEKGRVVTILYTTIENPYALWSTDFFRFEEAGGGPATATDILLRFTFNTDSNWVFEAGAV